jgi:hypothetical protein
MNEIPKIVQYYESMVKTLFDISLVIGLLGVAH